MLFLLKWKCSAYFIDFMYTFTNTTYGLIYCMELQKLGVYY